MFPLNNEVLEGTLRKLAIPDITNATIRQIGAVANHLEEEAGEEMIHLEMGNPGLPAEEEGI